MAHRMTRAEGLSRLRAYLDGGGIAPGDRLPPERDLAPRLGMSRATLRTALDALEAEGALWRHVGQGTFAGPRPVQQTVELPLLVEMTSPLDLMHARLLIEPEIAAAAAEAATPAQVAGLRAAAAAGRAAEGLHACEWADRRFHAALARATGNPVLASFLEVLSGARGRSTWQREWNRTYGHVGEATFRGGHTDHHLDIVTAVAAHDADAARAAMRRHLGAISDAMRAAMAGSRP